MTALAKISPQVRELATRANKRGFFFVNIGANDGVSNDIIYPFIQEYGWRGIAVEPLPSAFEQLRHNYRDFRGVILEQAAIAARPRAFHYISDATGYQHAWTSQVGSLNPMYVMKTIYMKRRWQFDGPVPDDLERAVTALEVPCLTFDELMRRHQVRRIDFLNIDAESADYEIFCSIDFARYRPSLMCLEVTEMSDDQRKDLDRRLLELNYVTIERFEFFSNIYAARELLERRSAGMTLRARIPLRWLAGQMR